MSMTYTCTQDTSKIDVHIICANLKHVVKQTNTFAKEPTIFFNRLICFLHGLPQLTDGCHKLLYISGNPNYFLAF